MIVPVKTKSHPRVRPRWLWLLFATLLIGPLLSFACAESETTVKAAYLLNFAKLVEWPAAAFSPGQSLVIGVVGRDSAAEELSRAFTGASANGRKIEVRHVTAGDAAALLVCHVIFVLESPARGGRRRGGAGTSSPSGG